MLRYPLEGKSIGGAISQCPLKKRFETLNHLRKPLAGPGNSDFVVVSHCERPPPALTGGGFYESMGVIQWK